MSNPPWIPDDIWSIFPREKWYTKEFYDHASAFGSGMKFGSASQPFFQAHFEMELTEDLLLRILNLWPGYRIREDGSPIPAEEDRKAVREALSERWPQLLVTMPGGDPAGSLKPWPQEKSHPLLSIKFGDVKHESKLLPSRYAVISIVDSDFDGKLHANLDIRYLPNSERYLDACRRLVRILRSPFAFGDVSVPNPSPLLHSWAVAYYGSKITRVLGGFVGRASTAPVHKVEWDLEGWVPAGEQRYGVWLYLDVLPFVRSPQLEARKKAVELHLGLRELFLNAGDAIT